MLDLDTRFDYLIVYKKAGEVNTWTMQQGALQVNLPQMKADKDCEILGIYEKLSSDEILDIILSGR